MLHKDIMKMQKKQIPLTGNTQAARLSEQLLKIRVDVTAADRAASREQFGYTSATISRYLNGNVYCNDTAVKLLTFFRRRISTREKLVKI